MQPTLPPNNRLQAGSLFSLSGPFPGRVFRALLLGLLLSSPLHGWAQYYVSPNGTAAPAAATSWASSTTDLQGAIEVAAPTSGTVYVATGLYQPGGSGNTTRTTSFSIASGVLVLGGYAGSGTPGTRTAFPSSSTLTGVLTGGNQSYHVVFMRDVAAGTTLDGFVITGGLADGAPFPDESGGGILSRAQSGSSSSPTLQNLLITGNTAAGSGGGIYAGGASHSLTAANLLIQNNTATFIHGGGLFASGGNSNLTSLTVTGNTAAQSGGGIYTSSSHTLVAANSLLTSNIASGTATTNGGGGLYANRGSSNLSSLTITGNRATNNGGGIYTDGGSLTATNTLIQSSTATGRGGGWYASGGSSNLSSLTVSGNTAGSDGGGVTTFSHTLVAANSLLTSNSASSGTSRSGGGLYASGGSSNLTSLTVTGNQANRGGGIFTVSSHTLVAANSLIQSNTATGTSEGGGGWYASEGSSNLSSLTVSGNRAYNGGGIYTTNSHTLVATNSLLTSNRVVATG